jgi:hypothetical protein
MKEFLIEGSLSKTKEATITANSRENAVKQFKEYNPEYTIESVNDEPVVAWCESCGMPIFESDEKEVHHQPDGDFYEFHKKCVEG